MLDELVHSVAACGAASEAFELLDSHAFYVMVTDLALPDLPGDQLAARALYQQPGLRVVFASGYEALPPSANGFEETVLLQKPYERSLAEALKAVTEASLA